MEGNLDPVTFYMEGKAMAHGYLPYRDLTDVKGVFLFFIYFIGYILSPDKTWGIFSVYVAFSYVFSIFCYKICTHKQLSPFYSLCGTLICLTIQYNKYTAYWGAQPDLLINTFQIWTLYYFLILLDSEEISRKTIKRLAISIGIGASAVFLIKYNVLITYSAFFLLALIIIRKKMAYPHLLHFSLIIILSALAFLTPFIIYLYANGVLNDFFNDYFSINFNCYTTKNGYYSNSSIISLITTKLSSLISGRFLFAGITLAYAAICLCRPKRVNSKSLIIFVLVSAFFLSSFVGHWGYYYILFAPVTIIPISHAIEKCTNIRLNAKKKTLTISTLLIGCIILNNHYRTDRGFRRPTEDILHLNSIDRQLSTVHQPKILYFGMADFGYGLNACALPACDSWFAIPGYTKSIEYQKKAIRSRLPDFIITTGDERELLNSCGYSPVPGITNLWKKHSTSSQPPPEN